MGKMTGEVIAHRNGMSAIHSYGLMTERRAVRCCYLWVRGQVIKGSELVVEKNVEAGVDTPYFRPGNARQAGNHHQCC